MQEAEDNDSDYQSSKRSGRRKKEEKAGKSTASSESTALTVDEVCSNFDMTDVEIEYTESEYRNLTTFKAFLTHVRPILQRENARVPMSKLMMLVEAKWRQFSEENPNLQSDGAPVAEDEVEEEEPPASPEYQPKASRSRSSGKKGRRSQKVPTLKIKFGKRKNASSEEEEEKGSNASERDSDAEFEKMLMVRISGLIYDFLFISNTVSGIGTGRGHKRGVKARTRPTSCP